MAQTMYHGSKGGIKGAIEPKSRAQTDFGSGFYMGEWKEQAWSVCKHGERPVYYTCEADFSGLKVFAPNFVQWALVVACNRGAHFIDKRSKLYNSVIHVQEHVDVMYGAIADDSMNTAFKNFSDSLISFETLLDALKVVGLGNQWVCKSTEACQRVKVYQEKLSELEVRAIQNFCYASEWREQQYYQLRSQRAGLSGTFLRKFMEGANDSDILDLG